MVPAVYSSSIVSMKALDHDDPTRPTPFDPRGPGGQDDHRGDTATADVPSRRPAAEDPHARSRRAHYAKPVRARVRLSGGGAGAHPPRPSRGLPPRARPLQDCVLALDQCLQIGTGCRVAGPPRSTRLAGCRSKGARKSAANGAAPPLIRILGHLAAPLGPFWFPH